jgi:hypothetical protein
MLGAMSLDKVDSLYFKIHKIFNIIQVLSLALQC